MRNQQHNFCKKSPCQWSMIEGRQQVKDHEALLKNFSKLIESPKLPIMGCFKSYFLNLF